MTLVPWVTAVWQWCWGQCRYTVMARRTVSGNVNLNARERRDRWLGISVSINNSINNYLYLIDVTLSGILLM